MPKNQWFFKFRSEIYDFFQIPNSQKHFDLKDFNRNI